MESFHIILAPSQFIPDLSLNHGFSLITFGRFPIPPFFNPAFLNTKHFYARYTCTPDGLFHTFHLSTDHSVRLGLSFDSKEPAQDFYNHLLQLTSDPANTGLKGPSLPNQRTHYYLDNVPQKSKQSTRPKARPNKMDISQPCSFQHVVSVSQSDFQKYFSLQTFVNKTFDEAKQALTQSGVRRKKAPAPPPPPVRQGLTSSMSCHNIYALQNQ